MSPRYRNTAAIAQLVEHRIRNAGVGGSSPSCGTILVHVRPGDMGNRLFRRHGLHICSERVVDCLQGSLFEVNVSEVIVHEADEPDAVIDLSDADALSAEHG